MAIRNGIQRHFFTTNRGGGGISEIKSGYPPIMLVYKTRQIKILGSVHNPEIVPKKKKNQANATYFNSLLRIPTMLKVHPNIFQIGE